MAEIFSCNCWAVRPLKRYASWVQNAGSFCKSRTQIIQR